MVRIDASSASKPAFDPAEALEIPIALRERCRFGPSQSPFRSSPSANAARSRLAPLTPMAGVGYTQSRPEDSQARQVVSMPLLTHLILLRRHRAQAILDRILSRLQPHDWGGKLRGIGSEGQSGVRFPIYCSDGGEISRGNAEPANVQSSLDGQQAYSIFPIYFQGSTSEDTYYSSDSQSHRQKQREKAGQRGRGQKGNKSKPKGGNERSVGETSRGYRTGTGPWQQRGKKWKIAGTERVSREGTGLVQAVKGREPLGKQALQIAEGQMQGRERFVEWNPRFSGSRRVGVLVRRGLGISVDIHSPVYAYSCTVHDPMIHLYFYSLCPLQKLWNTSTPGETTIVTLVQDRTAWLQSQCSRSLSDSVWTVGPWAQVEPSLFL